MPKKKNTVIFKPVQSSSKRKETTASIFKQNEHFVHVIEESFLSPVNNGREQQLDQSNGFEFNNEDSITNEETSNVTKQHPDQLNSREITCQEGKIIEKKIKNNIDVTQAPRLFLLKEGISLDCN